MRSMPLRSSQFRGKRRKLRHCAWGQRNVVIPCGSTNGTPAGGVRETAVAQRNTRASNSSVTVSAGAPTAATRPPSDVLASFGIDNLFNQYYVEYMNAEGQSAPGQPPAIVFPSPGITFKGGLKIRFGA